MQQPKQKWINILRQCGLLSAAEWLHFQMALMRDKDDNAAFCREHPEFIPLPFAAMHDAHGTTSFREYWTVGKIAADNLAKVILRHNPKPERVFEWGCGPARILRHMPGLLPQDTQFFGTDYNRESIAWDKKSVPGITFADNNLAPPLPFPDQSFNIAYAISVLTHLSAEQQDAWIKELRRVLRPEGHMILTTHGEYGIENVLLPHELKRFKNEGIVIRSGVEEGKRCYVSYHHPDYARDHLFKGLEICEFIPGTALIRQDMWVLR